MGLENRQYVCYFFLLINYVPHTNDVPSSKKIKIIITQFLDILACNPTPGGKIEGQVFVNGTLRRPTSFRKATCYVMQRDVLLSSATVREAIQTSALLKLPMTMTRKEKEARVDRVLEELGLIDCQHTLIGDELLGMKGVSGGQRRRVSIGIELVKEPRAIFLDEPTSGLDSEMAAAIMDTLHSLAAKDRTIALTIHQPNSLLTSQFDDFMLLAQGEMVYFGEWAGAVPFFASAGLHCPQYTNPTDFFMHAVQDPANLETLLEQQRRRGEGGSGGVSNGKQDEESSGRGGGDASTTTPLAVLPPSMSMSDTATTNRKEGGVSGGIVTSLDSTPQVPAWYQTYVLVERNWRNYIRHPLMAYAETAQYLFMGLFVGLMYLQLNNSIETGVQDRLASIWFGMAVLSFTPSYTAVTVWDKDRILLRREAGQAMYNVSAWVAARSIVVIPLQCLQTLVFGVPAFFMVGYAITASNFFTYLCAYALFQITSESIGVLCAACTKTSTSAILALTFILLLLLSFSGFLVSDVPVYFSWISKISYLSYALDAATISEFDHVNFVCTTGPPTCSQVGEVVPGYQLIPTNINNGLSPGINLLVLLGITVCKLEFFF